MGCADDPATKDHLAYAPDAKAASAEARLRERARAWVLDLDLTPLGEPPDYSTLIRDCCAPSPGI